jgi:hypothetical protein
MKRKSGHRSRARIAAAASVGLAFMLCLFFFADDSCAKGKTRILKSALSMYEADYRVSHFPITKSTYDTGDLTEYVGPPQNIRVDSMELIGPPLDAKVIPLPSGGGSGQVTSFFDVFTELDLGPGTVPQQVQGTAGITFRITDCCGGGGSGGTYDTEMLSLDLTGLYQSSGGLAPFMLRESPTLASVGQHMVTPAGDGTYFISSFFDVFTELSLDGGQTFYPASSSFRLNIASVPEPPALLLAALGATGCGLVARRYRPRCRSAS